MRHDETVIPVAGSLVRAYRAGIGPDLVLLHGGHPSEAGGTGWAGAVSPADTIGGTGCGGGTGLADLAGEPVLTGETSGLPGGARSAWEPVWTALSGRARVTAPDLPGFGGTPLGQVVPTPAGYAAWLACFLDACGIGPVRLAGLSLGSAIALRAALDMPQRIIRLALCDPCGAEPAELTCPVLLTRGLPCRVPDVLVTFLTSASDQHERDIKARTRLP